MRILDFYPVRVTRSSQVLCREYCILNYIQDGNLDACSLANIPRRVLVIRVDPDMYRIRVGYVWTGQFDLDTDRGGRGNF